MDDHQRPSGFLGWLLAYITFNTFFPEHMASVELTALYTTVASQAFMNQLTSQPPQTSFTVAYGQFVNITFQSPEPIPWAVVQAFAFKMLIATLMGSRMGYAMDFTGPNGNTVLRVGLKIDGMDEGVKPFRGRPIKPMATGTPPAPQG